MADAIERRSDADRRAGAFAPVDPPEPADPRRAWASLDPDSRDAAYDNNRAVADSAALIEDRNRVSAHLRATRNGALDIPYDAAERTRFDLYPSADRAAPCLLFLHGGYWLRNSREVFAAIVEGVGAHGWSVAIPGYTLAPEATLTRIAGEIWTALDWFAANAPAHGIAGPTILAGWSAGAQLTCLGLAHPQVAAGLAISGVLDLDPLRDTYLDATLRITDEEVATLSPLRLPVVPKPLTIAYGTRELPSFVWDSRRLHRMRAAAHAPGALLPVAGANHFSILAELRRPDGLLVQAARNLAEGHRS